MKTLKENIIKIFKEDKGLLALMIITLLLGVILFFYTILILNPDGAAVKIGYDDISRGYESGAWTGMLVYPIATMLFGVLHNLLAVRLFESKGGGAAKVFLGVTIGLMIGMFILLLRLVVEK